MIHTLLRAGLFALAFLLFAPIAVLAQDAAAPADAAPAEAAAEAPAEPEPPAYPEDLANPGIPLEELQLRLIPLTVDELDALAGAWLENVKRQTEAVVERQIAINGLEETDPTIGEQRERLTELTAQRNEAFERFTAVVSNFARKGGDEAKAAQYRAYRSSIVVEEKQRADWRTLMNQAIAWATSRDGGIELAIQASVILGSLIGLFIVARIFRGIARRWFSRIPNLSKLLQGFLAMIVYWLVIAFGLMVVLSSLGIDITPVFALVGGASFIMAFAMQDTLGNLAAGLMIMINHPFDEGDYVTVGGVGGTVKSVSIVSTTVTTPDNQVIVIPNSKVWGDIITNVTASDTRRVDMVFGIGYDDDIEAAQKVLEDTVLAHPLVLSDPAPVIRVNELADSSVNFIVRPWAKSGDYWTVYWDLMRQVKTAFDAAGISIPYPQTDLHVRLPSGLSLPGAGALPPAAAAAAAASAPSGGTGRPEGVRDFAAGDEGFHDDGGDERA